MSKLPKSVATMTRSVSSGESKGASSSSAPFRGARMK
jgi:hypothetical protein